MHNAKHTPGFLHLLPLKGGGEWLHMCIRHQETSSYLMDEAALDDLIVAALVEEDTRSRLRVRDDGIMVLLKAMRVEGQATPRPEDMVSMRLWLTPSSVISTREADVGPILDIAARLNADSGPATPGNFLADLIEKHLEVVERCVEQMEDETTRSGAMVARYDVDMACPNMSETETRISGFLRHLGPQRAVLEILSDLHHQVLDDRDRARLDDALARLLRFIEALQTLRERIDILNNQIGRIQDRRLSRSTYIFAAVATIFLPLSFLTGLFGVNLMGLPFSESTRGFWALAAICVAIVAVALVVLAVCRWRKWL